MIRLLTLVVLFVSAGLAHGQGTSFLGKTTQAWQTELASKDANARRSAAFALGKIGSPAFAALPALQKAMRGDKEPRVREAAACALGEIVRGSLQAGTDATLVTTLGEALTSDADPRVRRSAAFALGCLGREGTAGLKSLLAALEDRDPAVRQNVGWALGKLGPAGVDGLQTALKDTDVLVQRDAAAGLAGLEPADIEPALPALFDLCKASNSESRRAALGALIKAVGPAHSAGAPVVRTALSDADEEVRNLAALTLSNIGGEEAADAVPVLVQALHHADVDLRRQAAAAIRNIGPAAAKAVPDLVKCLGDPDNEMKRNAALSLAGIGAAAADAYPALIALVENPKESSDTRIEAAVALARIGTVPAAVRAVPALLQVVANPKQDPRVRERVIWALRVHNARLRDLEGVYDAFTMVLGEPPAPANRMLRYDCAFMLGMLQGRAVPPQVMETLHEFLKDDKIQIYTGTTVTVGAVGAETTGAKADTKERGKGDGRVMAVKALLEIGPQRVSRHAGIVRELRALAGDAQTYADLRTLCKRLLSELSK